MQASSPQKYSIWATWKQFAYGNFNRLTGQNVVLDSIRVKVQRKLKIFAYKNRVLLLQLESVQLIWKNCGIIDQKVPITKDLF